MAESMRALKNDEVENPVVSDDDSRGFAEKGAIEANAPYAGFPSKFPNDSAQAVLRDLILTGRDWKNEPEKPVPKMSEKELQNAAADICHFVAKRNDFGTEYQRGELGKLFSKALNSGDLDKLVEKVNEQLEKSGSNYKVDFKAKEEVQRYGHWGMSGSNPNTMELKHPIWIKDYDKIVPKAELFLRDTSTGRIEDGITCNGNVRIKGHPWPEGATSRKFDSVPENDPIRGRYRQPEEFLDNRAGWTRSWMIESEIRKPIKEWR